MYGREFITPRGLPMNRYIGSAALEIEQKRTQVYNLSF